jgi:hypothetical protein
MKKRARFWLVAFLPLTLISVAFFCLSMMALPRLRDPGAQPALLLAGILLSGCTGAYCTVELVKCFRDRRTFLPPALAVGLILASLATSVFCTAGAMPTNKRSVDTTIIPQLALPLDDPRIITPKPTTR